jgi:hypothetical protein
MQYINKQVLSFDELETKRKRQEIPEKRAILCLKGMYLPLTRRYISMNELLLNLF